MKIVYYQSMDHNDAPYAPPWLDWMKHLEDLDGDQRRTENDTFEVHWRAPRERARDADAVLVGSRFRRYLPASTEIASGRTGRAPSQPGREYSERIIVGRVAPTVFGVIRVGNQAAQHSTVTQFLSHRTGLTENDGIMMHFRRILSPQFLEKLHRSGNVVGSISFRTSMAGARRIYGEGFLASRQALRQRDPDGMVVSVQLELDNQKRNAERLEDSERLDGLALLEEARNLADHADLFDSGTIMLLEEGGRRREPVFLAEAYLKATARFDGDDRWVDPVRALDAMHAQFAPLRSQVEPMLGA